MCKLLSSKKLLYCKKKKALFCMLWDDDVLLFCVWQWDGEVSIWDSRTTQTLSQAGVGEQMEKNGDAREMP